MWMGVAGVMDVSGGRWRMAVDRGTPGVRNDYGCGGRQV